MVQKYTAATPKTYWYIHDAHDNVIGMADSNGYRVVNYEYDAWGNILNATGIRVFLLLKYSYASIIYRVIINRYPYVK